MCARVCVRVCTYTHSLIASREPRLICGYLRAGGLTSRAGAGNNRRGRGCIQNDTHKAEGKVNQGTVKHVPEVVLSIRRNTLVLLKEPLCFVCENACRNNLTQLIGDALLKGIKTVHAEGRHV